MPVLPAELILIASPWLHCIPGWRIGQLQRLGQRGKRHVETADRPHDPGRDVGFGGQAGQNSRIYSFMVSRRFTYSARCFLASAEFGCLSFAANTLSSSAMEAFMALT